MPHFARMVLWTFARSVDDPVDCARALVACREDARVALGGAGNRLDAFQDAVHASVGGPSASSRRRRAPRRAPPSGIFRSPSPSPDPVSPPPSGVAVELGGTTAVAVAVGARAAARGRGRRGAARALAVAVPTGVDVRRRGRNSVAVAVGVGVRVAVGVGRVRPVRASPGREREGDKGARSAAARRSRTRPPPADTPCRRSPRTPPRDCGGSPASSSLHDTPSSAPAASGVGRQHRVVAAAEGVDGDRAARGRGETVPHARRVLVGAAASSSDPRPGSWRRSCRASR